MAVRHSAAGCPKPGSATASAPAPRSRIALASTMTRTSTTSARPAAAIPRSNTTSRETKKALATRPRTSRGVLRWIASRRAIEDGALANPDRVTSAMATATEVEPAYKAPTNPIPRKLKAIHWPSRNRSASPAIKKLPTTNPMEVSASCKPYSNSLACNARKAKGRRSEFHSPKLRKTGTEIISSERRMEESRRWRAPSFRLRTMVATLVAPSTMRGGTATKSRQAAERANDTPSR